MGECRLGECECVVGLGGCPIVTCACVVVRVIIGCFTGRLTGEVLEAVGLRHAKGAVLAPLGVEKVVGGKIEAAGGAP